MVTRWLRSDTIAMSGSPGVRESTDWTEWSLRLLAAPAGSFTAASIAHTLAMSRYPARSRDGFCRRSAKRDVMNDSSHRVVARRNGICHSVQRAKLDLVR